MCQGASMDEGIRRLATCASTAIACELCEARASLYCEADGAYLCRKCDEWVHSANFLAKRHVRCVLCKTCQKLTHRYRVGALDDVSSRRSELSECDKDKRTFLFL